MERMTTQERTRFMGCVSIQPNGCWRWTRPLDRDGYGVFYFRKRNRRAHRVAYWAAKGDIPKGLVTDHLCCNPWCVNPDHLEVVTAWENTRRSGKSLPALNALKTACPKGHAYDRKYNGQRCCSICESEKRKRLRAKWKAEADSVAC